MGTLSRPAILASWIAIGAGCGRSGLADLPGRGSETPTSSSTGGAGAASGTGGESASAMGTTGVGATAGSASVGGEGGAGPPPCALDLVGPLGYLADDVAAGLE